jgi:glycosyltransferase involved in cell wall biosynthesis
MKYLVIGDAGSIFIKQYIEYVLLDPQNEIVLIQEGGLTDSYKEFYQKNNVKVESLWQKKWSFVQKIPRVRAMVAVPLWCNYIKKKYGEFDCVHIHGVSRSRGDLALRLRKFCRRMIVTVWGDELFRLGEKTLAKFEKYYVIADAVTVATQKMYQDFLKVYGQKYAERLSVNKFAIGLFEKIEKTKSCMNREELCRSFGIKQPEKLAVLVGHNGRPAQRHTEITRALLELPREYAEKITLVYTMTYGVKSEQYVEEMVAEAKKIGSDFVVLRDFMDEETSARLRCVCDVLLHAQLTDAFSASIQESLYSGSVILNGSWLPYEELPNYRECMVLYDDLSQISTKLMDVIDRYEEYRTKFSANRETLRAISSREVTTKQWKDVISRVMQ